MKRNDIGDSYVLGCSSGSLRRGECIHQKDDHLCWQALCATVTGQPVRGTERLCRHANHWKCPVEMVSIPLARRHGRRVSVASSFDRQSSPRAQLTSGARLVQAACATLPAHSSLQVARRYRADAISATTADPCYLMNPRDYVKLRTYAPLFPFSAFPTSGLPTGTVPGSASGRSRPTHWSPDRKPVGNSAKRRSSSTSIGTASRGSNVQWPGSGRRCGRRSTGC